MAGFSEGAANSALDHALSIAAWSIPAGAFVSLHTADPGETGTSEVTGGGYARQGDTPFVAASGGASSNTNDIVYTNMPNATVTHVGIWDQVSGGTFLFGGSFTQSQPIGAGESFTIKAGDLDVTLD
jgi:hypothetical protein